MAGNDSESGGSIRTVAIAFGVNFLVAAAKTVAAIMTSSASMIAEAAHSWADTGNEVFLLFAERLSARESTKKHPLGFGKEAYVWSMFAAMGLFTAGAVVSVMHGISQLGSDEPSTEYFVAYIVLGVSLILESISFTQAFRQAHAIAVERGRGTIEHVMASSNPTRRAVFAEDAAALIGIGIAFLGVLLHEVTGLAIFDAAGSILIGILLAVVAIILIQRNRRFLVGQSPPKDVEESVIAELLSHEEVDRVTYLHLEFVGPGSLFMVAAIDLEGNRSESEMALALRRVEQKIEEHPAIAEAVLTLSAADDPSLKGGPLLEESERGLL